MLTVALTTDELDEVLAIKLWCLLKQAAWRACRNEHIAEDTASKVFLGVLRNPIYVLEHAECIMSGCLPGRLGHRAKQIACRHTRKRCEVSLDKLPPNVEPLARNIVELEPSPAHAFVRSLPDVVDQEILQMRVNGMNQNEIAEVLQMSTRAVRYRKAAIEEKAKLAGLRPTWRHPA